MENQTSLTKCLITAEKAGAPRDQADTFISVGYIPLPWQWEFHAAAREADKSDGPVDIGVGGARGPGKSHAVLAQAGFDDCQRIPNLKGLFLRQTGVAAKESFDDLIQKVLTGRIKYDRVTNALKFPNGSRIVLGGFKTASDIDKYIGIEYDFIIVEELNQLTADKYVKLRGSLRTSKPDWRPRMYTSFNPGGIGHGHVKERYVIPNRENREKETRFIGSNYLSNPYLNKEYIQFLESLTGDLAKAWREGEWDIFAGQYFKEFRFNYHVVKPYKVVKTPDNVIIGGMDWGRTGREEHKAAFAFYLDEVKVHNLDGIKFYRSKTFFEVAGKDKTPREWAVVIKQKLKDRGLTLENIAWIRGDPAMFTKGQDNSISIADQFKNEGITIKPASNDRMGGWEILHNWLSIAPDGLPYWMIAEDCSYLTTTLPELVHDENRVEDVDTDGDDHGADAQRYQKKHLKWIDAKLGGVRYRSPNAIQRRSPIYYQGQIGVDPAKFANAGVKKSRIGGIK